MYLVVGFVIFLLRINDGIFIHINGSEVFEKFHRVCSSSPWKSRNANADIFQFWSYIPRRRPSEEGMYAKIGRRWCNKIPVNIQFTQARIPTKALRDVVIISKGISRFHFHIAWMHHWCRFHLMKLFTVYYTTYLGTYNINITE